MALALLTDLTTMIPELQAIDPGIISFYLNQAQRLVQIDGFLITDPNFDILQLYMSGHLLMANNIIRTTVQSESVQGSISISYEKTKDPNYTDPWQRKYIAFKNQLQGAPGRVV